MAPGLLLGPFAMPKEADSSTSDKAPSDGASDASSVIIARPKRARRSLGSGSQQHVGDIIMQAEEENLECIRTHLAGKMDLQSLVIHMLEKGSLKQKQKVEPKEPMAATSTNKFNLLSVENWADVLTMFDGIHFDKEVLMAVAKKDLCKVGCMIAGIDPTSALISRKLKVVAKFMKKRATEIYSDLYLRVKFERPENSEQRSPHDFDSNGMGIFDVQLNEAKTKGKIIHVGTKQEVDMPKEMIKHGEGKVYNNYSEQAACFKGEYSDPPIIKVFEKAGKTLPKLFWIKKIGDYATTSELLGEDLGAAVEGTRPPQQQHAEGSAHRPSTEVTALGSHGPAPPAGEGGADPPPM